MLAFGYETIGYVYAGPQSSFRHAEQTLDHDTLIVIEQGAFEYGIQGERGTAAFGDLVFCPAKAGFRRRALGEIVFHHIHLRSRFPDEGSVRLPVGKFPVGDVSRLASSLRYMGELYRGDYPEAMKRKAIYEHFVPELLWLCEWETYHAERRRQKSDPLMERALRELHQHAFEPFFGANRIAARLKLHPSLFSRRFKAAHGVSPIAYLTRLRLEEAKRLLLETDETMEAIASRCGYETGAYFSRVFRSKEGMNPSAFRQAYRL